MSKNRNYSDTASTSVDKEVGETGEPKTKMALVETGKLNLRQAASTSSKALYVLNKGEVLYVLEDRNEWLKVFYKKQGLTGYVMKKFVRVE